MQKVALVTGSYQGIGKGIADLLKKEGYKVIYSDVRDEMAGEEYVKCDISKAEDRQNLVKYVDEMFG